MRNSIGMLLLLLAVGGIGVIVGRSIVPPARPLLRGEAAAGAGLDRLVDEVDFRQTSFKDAIETLRSKSGTNIVVRWQTLDQAGVEPTASTTLRLTRLPVGRVLSLLCDDVSTQAGVALDWSVDGETVIVTTADENGRYTQIRMYDVRDLIESHYAYRVQTGWKPAPPERAASLLGAVSSAGVAGDPRAEAVETLTHLVYENVAPDAWRDAGGTIGSIREIDGRFVITATPAMHEEVVRLLELLRKGK
jgi:hypothetical protein